MRSLAIIEHDPWAAADLRRTVESAGFLADCFSEGRAAVFSLKQRPFSLAIVDLEILDTDPLAICREVSRMMPVIGVTSTSDEETCIRALESGADDCIHRPVSGRELLARIENILRRTGSDQAPNPGALFRSIAEMRVRQGDTTYDLTRGEAEVLAVLLKHSPSPLTAVRIAEVLGARRGTVESRIKSLRRKLGGARIVSRGRLGYQVEDAGTALLRQ